MEKVASIRNALNDAMRRRSTIEVSTLRMMLSGLKDREIALRADGASLDEDAFCAVLRTMVKKRRESADLYEKGGREELARQEKEEINVIAAFLPKAMDATEIEAAVDDVIGQIRQSGGNADIGRIMGMLKKTHGHQIDMKVAGQIVRKKSGQVVQKKPEQIVQKKSGQVVQKKPEQVVRKNQSGTQST